MANIIDVGEVSSSSQGMFDLSLFANNGGQVFSNGVSYYIKDYSFLICSSVSDSAYNWYIIDCENLIYATYYSYTNSYYSEILTINYGTEIIFGPGQATDRLIFYNSTFAISGNNINRSQYYGRMFKK